MRRLLRRLRGSQLVRAAVATIAFLQITPDRPSARETIAILAILAVLLCWVEAPVKTRHAYESGRIDGIEVMRKIRTGRTMRDWSTLLDKLTREAQIRSAFPFPSDVSLGGLFKDAGQFGYSLGAPGSVHVKSLDVITAHLAPAPDSVYDIGDDATRRTWAGLPVIVDPEMDPDIAVLKDGLGKIIGRYRLDPPPPANPFTNITGA